MTSLPALIPLPNSITEGPGDPFVLAPTTRLSADPACRAEVDLFAADLRRATGYDLPIADDPSVADGPPAAGTPATITFAVDPGADLGDESSPESYRIDSDATGVSVVGASPHGILNATQTLRQLLPAGLDAARGPAGGPVLDEWRIPAVRIVDGPVYAYRGVMIDVARSFLTVAEMEHVIDQLAAAKFSRLHLHLTDDQGWRLEITNDHRADGDTIDYTRLTAISGATAMTEWGYRDEPGRTGFYTQAQYRHLMDYAARRHIEVIPEIDLPGHTHAALAAIPELNTPGSSHTGTPEQPVAPANGSGEVGHSYLDPHSEATYTFIRHVLSQLAALTPGEYIHIGGDEPLKMTERYLREPYVETVARIVEIVRDIGKKPVGWNEVAESKVGEDIIVQYWDGPTEHTVRAAIEGAQILHSRGTSAYLDQKYHADTPIGLTWACSGDCDFPAYYSWDPGAVIPDLPAGSIAGVEGPLWSETVRGLSQINFLMNPRAHALAELGWTRPGARDLDDFTARIARLGARLLLSGSNFYDGAKATWSPAVVGIPVPSAAAPGGTAPDGTSPGGIGAVRVAILAAPGGTLPEITVEIQGVTLAAETRLLQDRGPVHAGPLVEVWVEAAGLEGAGVITAGAASAPLRIGG